MICRQHEDNVESRKAFLQALRIYGRDPQHSAATDCYHGRATRRFSRYRKKTGYPLPRCYTTSLHPIDPSVKSEQLRAYHSRLDVINDAFLGDPENADWKAEFIERFLT